MGMVNGKHLSGWKEISSYLNMDPRKLNEHRRRCEKDDELPTLPAYRVDGKGPYRITTDDLDAWWSSYISVINNSDRTPYMKRVDPEA